MIAAGKDYLFALKDEHRIMCRLADELLATEPVLDCAEDRLDDATTVSRSLRLIRADQPGPAATGKNSIRPHCELFSVEYAKVHQGQVIERDERMHISSLDPESAHSRAVAPPRRRRFVRS